MPTYIPSDAENVNLSNYGGATDLVVPPGSFIYGANYGDTAIVSGAAAGITLTSDEPSSAIRGHNGQYQTSLTSAGGTGGIGVNLTVADTFYNGSRVIGGNGGSYTAPYSNFPASHYPDTDAGAGGVGVQLANGAILNNDDSGVITGGGGGGVFDTVSGNNTFYETGPAAVGVEVVGGSVFNTGAITGGGEGFGLNSGYGAAGVRLDSGNTPNYLQNTGTGTITGGQGNAGGGTGVDLASYTPATPGTQGVIYNSGQITGGYSGVGIGGDGVEVASGLGFATNVVTDLDNTGTISGGDGFGGGGIGIDLAGNDIAYTSGTVEGGNATGGSNNGGVGVAVDDGSSFESDAGVIRGGAGYGSGHGGAGIYVGGSGSGDVLLFDTKVYGGAGGSSGTMGDAVQFGSAGNLGIFSIDTFDGQVAGTGNLSTADSLSLYDSGTLAGFGTQFTGFSSLVFNDTFAEAAAAWTVDATQASLSANYGTSVDGFRASDTLDVTNLTWDTGETGVFIPSGTAGDGTLEIINALGGTVQSIYFDGLTNTNFSVSPDGTGGTDINVACYRRGTRIRTTRGEVPIEALSISDQVVCSSGNTRPVRWLGHRSIGCSRYAEPSSVWPICIRAGAFADQQPARDLWVSPGHAVLVDGVLVQAYQLINGVTVVRVRRERVEYWHVELDAHDTLLAEGLASESYLDTGNRTAFVNSGAFLEAYPDFRAKHWSETCAPLVTDGVALQQARARLLQRAKKLGYSITNDADVHVVADGDRIDPVSLDEKRIAFLIPAARSSIELRSRTFVPSHVNAVSRDLRSLGICVGRLQIDGNDWALDDETKFANGWQELERDDAGTCQRWTCGRTPLPAGTRLVVIDIPGRSYCWQEPEQAVALCG